MCIRRRVTRISAPANVIAPTVHSKRSVLVLLSWHSMILLQICFPRFINNSLINHSFIQGAALQFVKAKPSDAKSEAPVLAKGTLTGKSDVAAMNEKRAAVE